MAHTKTSPLDQGVLYAASHEGHGPLLLGRNALTVPLIPTAHLLAWVEGKVADPKEVRLYLMFEDMRVTTPSEAVYNVFLGLPPGAEPRLDSPHYVGTLAFFNAVVERDPTAAGPAVPRSSVIKISQPLQRQLRQGRLTGALAVTLVPSQPTADDSAPRIGRVLLFGKAVD